MNFANAPISKIVFFLATAASFAALVSRSSSSWYDLTLDALFKQSQVWRLLTFAFTFSPMNGEFLFGLLLLYNMHDFEKRFGSRKFGGALLSLFTLTFLLQLVTMLIFPQAKPSPGPYWFCFGFLFFFWLDTPSRREFRIFNLPLSEKWFIYLLGIQLVFASRYGSTASSCCAMIAGFLLRFIPCLLAIRPPWWLCNICTSHIMPLIASAPEEALYSPVAQEDPNQQQQPAAPLVVPDESAVQRLLAMGFAENDVRRVLISSENNIAIASARLADNFSRPLNN
eukprot:TRINITY_DN2470_c0_g1_i1.p1 TRINITY_DN2470_c0_g1~~TRINITY_DN2470_c0_g1_i1.p1  ORF type:complete len:312 (-),score=44.96 TRINITY_DN2470_c0_g1_i1:121-969(-)